MTLPTQPYSHSAKNYLDGLFEPSKNGLIADLSLNENPLGASAFALEAYLSSSNALAVYPDGQHVKLRRALSDRFRIDPDRIGCGAGADDLISLLARLFINPGDEVIIPEFSFRMFHLHTLQARGVPIVARAPEFTASVGDIVSNITERTKLIFIANPNNPTGTFLPRAQMKALVDAVPATIPIVIDSVYSDYVDDVSYSDCSQLADDFANVVVLRSFSKIFGLASLRVGWCYSGADTAKRLNSMRGPYNISGPAQAAAVAALDDVTHVTRSSAHNRLWMARLCSELGHAGYRIPPSGGNFIMLPFATSRLAKNCHADLLSNGLLVRKLEDYQLPHCLRITIGRDMANERLLSILSRVSVFNPAM